MKSGGRIEQKYIIFSKSIDFGTWDSCDLLIDAVRFDFVVVAMF